MGESFRQGGYNEVETIKSLHTPRGLLTQACVRWWVGGDPRESSQSEIKERQEGLLDNCFSNHTQLGQPSVESFLFKMSEHALCSNDYPAMRKETRPLGVRTEK